MTRHAWHSKRSTSIADSFRDSMNICFLSISIWYLLIWNLSLAPFVGSKKSFNNSNNGVVWLVIRWFLIFQHRLHWTEKRSSWHKIIKSHSHSHSLCDRKSLRFLTMATLHFSVSSSTKPEAFSRGNSITGLIGLSSRCSKSRFLRVCRTVKSRPLIKSFTVKNVSSSEATQTGKDPITQQGLEFFVSLELYDPVSWCLIYLQIRFWFYGLVSGLATWE